MSSRALRRMQREREQQRQLENPQNHEEDDLSEEDEPIKPKAVNTFDMLNQAEDDDSAKQDTAETEDTDHAQDPEDLSTTGLPKPKAKPKRKKKGKNKRPPHVKQENQTQPKSVSGTERLDEIDLALRSLSTGKDALSTNESQAGTRESFPEMYKLLAIDSRNLNATNEMKRLFGNVVLEDEEAENEPGPARRRGRAQQLDLGGALAGRNSPASRGQGLAGLALRRNVFMAGKESWPKATSGGLGMELVEKLSDGTTEFQFVHNTSYQDVQTQFQTCVESLDPQRLISLLQFHPYHISTLLQVSEIAKQQGDHSVSGDLLERALFSFGRSVHSSFIKALSEGKARLDFRRPENREFWLAAWRYISNLGQRGTWRTSYEWAKLILSLDPEGDPYCVALNIDQLALRGGQSEHLDKLSNCNPLNAFINRPNLHISSALAKYKLKDAEGCRLKLREAVEAYPYIFSRLFQELNLEHVPKAIWGKQPRSPREKLECEAYVHNAKDLWNTPEAISFLVEVVESSKTPDQLRIQRDEISLDEARHVLLSGIPSLINLLPRSFTTMRTSSSDPLPPPNNILSYDATIPIDRTRNHRRAPTAPQNALERIVDLPADRDDPPAGAHNDTADQEAQELHWLQNFFSRIVPGFGGGRAHEAPNADQEFDRAAAESGVTPEVITERGNRLVQLLRTVIGRQNEEGVGMQGLPPIMASEDLDHASSEPEISGAEDQFVDLPDLVESEEPTSSAQIHEEPYDDERNQRWLAGQGMIGLRDYTAKYGADESAWGSHTTIGEEMVTEYAKRVLQLRQQRTRDFIVNYPLRQGTSVEVRDLVQRFMERQHRGA